MKPEYSEDYIREIKEALEAMFDRIREQDLQDDDLLRIVKVG